MPEHESWTAFYAALGRVAANAASLENELHRAAVDGLGGGEAAEEFVRDLTNTPTLVKLFRITHAESPKTDPIATRCKPALEKRNHVVHGSPEWVFDPDAPGQAFRPRWRKRRGKGDQVPTVDEMVALAEELGSLAREVYEQRVGLSVGWDEQRWSDML